VNYQILLESYATGEGINKDKISLLELELDSQLESIKFSRTQYCTEIASKHICDAAQVCDGSNWIICFASILDKANPLSIGTKSKIAKVIDALLDNNYLMN
tara:strand:- start:249 stop:551 length:303 start_codon:yes stop_codon:yes gene_type:complete